MLSEDDILYELDKLSGVEEKMMYKGEKERLLLFLRYLVC